MVASSPSKRFLEGVCFFAFWVGFSGAQAQGSAPAAEPTTQATAVKLPARTTADRVGFIQKGKISYYSTKFNGRKTASGEMFDSKKLTMAHRTLPFGTLVEVTHAKSKRFVIVRVNDRGPKIASRIGDLSQAAATKLGIIHTGLAQVSLRVVGGAGDSTGASTDTSTSANRSASRNKK